MKRTLTLVATLLMVIVLMIACASQTSQTAMTFKTVGVKGSTVYITLVFPNPDAVSPQDLANRLRQDWKDARFSGIAAGHVDVWVFDNEDAPQKYLAIFDRLLTMSEQEWNGYQIFSHLFAEYEENTTTGLHDVLFYSRDTEHNIVQTIKF